MIYHFNIYDSRHHGWLLNQISNEEYELLLKGEDEEYNDYNPISLDLDINETYHLWVEFDYNYWSSSGKFILSEESPELGEDDYTYHHFVLNYDVSNKCWLSFLVEL